MTFQTDDAWGGDDLMLDEEGNPDVDEDEMQSAASEKEDKEGGWDVSDNFFSFLYAFKLRLEEAVIKCNVEFCL